MAWPTTKDLSKYAYNQFKGNFLGFFVGTLAARLVSTFFETRKISNLWGLTAKKTVVSGSTFRFLEWSCALIVGFIAFELVNKLVKEKVLKRILCFIRDRGLMSAFEASAPRTYEAAKSITRFTKTLVATEENDNEPMRRTENSD